VKVDVAFIKQQKRFLTGALIFLALWIGATLVFIAPGERLGFVLFSLLILGLGFANALYPGVLAFVFKLFGWCLGLWFGLFVTSLLFKLFSALSDVVLTSDSTSLRVLVLTIWFLLLLSSAFVVMYGRTRERLFNRMSMLASLVYSLTLLLISIQFFAVATFLLQESGCVTLTLGSAQALSVDAVADFFSWHFLRSACGGLDIAGLQDLGDFAGHRGFWLVVEAL
jgi:hypothetical protein